MMKKRKVNGNFWLVKGKVSALGKRILFCALPSLKVDNHLKFSKELIQPRDNLIDKAI